jgi:hypothetical protein
VGPAWGRAGAQPRRIPHLPAIPRKLARVTEPGGEIVAKARRAKRSAARIVVPVVAALVLLSGGAVAAWKFWPQLSTSAGPTPSVEATQSTAQPTTATPSETSTATPSPTPEPNPNAVKAQRAHDDCRATVEAGDAVIKEAKTGVDHWAGHVESQVLADRGAITITQMKERFKETRLKGPADHKRYRDALKEYEDQDASCKKVEKAPSKINATLAKCATRNDDQQSVLETGAAGMRDWASHLAFMLRNKTVHVSNAQTLWVKAYRAAPTNINAFNRAVAAYDPPKC